MKYQGIDMMIFRISSGQISKSLFLRVMITGLILVLFMSFASVLINIIGIYDSGLNLLVFIVPILIVYIGTGGEKSDIICSLGKKRYFVPKKYLALIIVFVVPFIIFALLIPLIQIIISEEMSVQSFYEITAAYFNSVRSHLLPSLGLGIAGIGGLLRTKSIPLSLLCLVVSPFISLLNTASSL